MPITHSDGAQYWSQAEIDSMISDRLKNHGTKLTEAEQRASTWEQRWKAAEPQFAGLSALTAERDEWKSKATNAEGGLSRYRAAASYNVTDPDTIEALESAHTKAMKGVDESKRMDFAGFLTAAKADPNLLPSYLRGVFAGGSAPTGASPGSGGASASGANAMAPAAPAAPARPPWASAVAGQAAVSSGQQQSFTDRVGAARSLDELVQIQQERVASRRG